MKIEYDRESDTLVVEGLKDWVALLGALGSSGVSGGLISDLAKGLDLRK